jgi:hypothetical protein
MSNVVIRPDLRTAGGEINDILYEDQFAGTLALVYREGERISGSIQLDKEFLTRKQKERVVEAAQNYVQALIDALDAPECDVLVTYSRFDRVIATEHNVGEITEFMDPEDASLDIEYDYVDEDTRFNDVDGQEIDDYLMDDDEAAEEPVYYELVIVGESRNTVEYHVYNQGKEWIAEAFMTIYGTDVVGEVNWTFMPTEEQIGHVTDLIVSDFDDNEVDTFHMDVKFQGEIIDIEELTHEALLDSESFELTDGDDDYSVILSRDDADTLTYEIYRQTNGGLPIGTATIDISQRELTGFIDFKELAEEHDREHIVTLLMNELDKEKDFSTFNITILHENEPIDEILFETEQIH